VVAVKRLSNLDRDLFECELEVLQNLRKREHLRQHLATILASYEQNDYLHLILPWAECDLDRYWKFKFPMGLRSTSGLSSWLKQQCCGISQAVSQLHRYQTSSGTTMLEKNRSGPQTREGGDSKKSSGRRRILLFGRHGDVKPANILWFPDRSSNRAFGTLKLTDFGTARFSGKEKAVVEDRTTVPNSRAYQSPECVLPDGNISSQCDVWSLGCVFLEFVCWYFGGRDLLLEFERDRSHLYETPSFFATTTYEKPRSMFAEVKKPVTKVRLP
jgi:serine/threonine protein kinase